MASPFTTYLAENYGQFKELARDLGRRKAKLRLLADFWALITEDKERLAQIAEDPSSQSILADALEDINSLEGVEEEQISQYVEEGSVAGILVRTDYSDDAAWNSFVETLINAEKDLAMPIDEEAAEGPGSTAQTEEEDSESEDEDEDEQMSNVSGPSSSPVPASLFALLSPPETSALRSRITNISNLAALRLVNDADAVRGHLPPPGTQRSRSDTAHRLSELHGFVEAYRGPLVWIYDARSNSDRAARVVSHCAEGFGAATGDSWRARATFLPELQLNLVNGTMKIDFGGLDRWDHVERQRNIAEADASVV